MLDLKTIAEAFLVPTEMTGYVYKNLPCKSYTELNGRLYLHRYVASIVVKAWLVHKKEERERAGLPKENS